MLKTNKLIVLAGITLLNTIKGSQMTSVDEMSQPQTTFQGSICDSLKTSQPLTFSQESTLPGSLPLTSSQESTLLVSTQTDLADSQPLSPSLSPSQEVDEELFLKSTVAVAPVPQEQLHQAIAADSREAVK